MDTDRFILSARDGTVGDVVLQRLRFDIIQGALLPGTRLRLERLRQSYGASVTTLREMLNRLVAEGFVVAEGQRGFQVAPVCIAELRELGQMRNMLESHALEQSLMAGTLAWEAGVISAHHMLRASEHRLSMGDRGVIGQWVQCDWIFHHATVSACDMPTLMATHANIFQRYMRYHLLALDFRGAGVIDDHRRLCDLVIARDAPAAIALLGAHIRAGMDHVIASGKIPG